MEDASSAPVSSTALALTGPVPAPAPAPTSASGPAMAKAMATATDTSLEPYVPEQAPVEEPSSVRKRREKKEAKAQAKAQAKPEPVPEPIQEPYERVKTITINVNRKGQIPKPTYIEVTEVAEGSGIYIPTKFNFSNFYKHQVDTKGGTRLLNKIAKYYGTEIKTDGDEKNIRRLKAVIYKE